MSKRFGFGGLLLGSAIGAGIALLFTTKKGEELRKDLLDKISELCDKLRDIDSDEVKADVEKKVKKAAAEKGEQLKAKAEELVKYAKEKGEPALIDSSEAILKKVIKVSKDALKRLEEKEKSKAKEA